MAIQYYMRGYNTAAPGAVGYVDWVVNDQPDTSATFVPSPYSSANIHNITVNKVVTSKVGNFLNPAAEPSFISPNFSNPIDPYFLHVNSYDWLNPNPPHLTTGIPTSISGLAIVRGTSNGTNLNPYAGVFWNESLSQWQFAQINADGSIGTSQQVATGSMNVIGHLGVENLSTDTEASAGLIRIPNNEYMMAASNPASSNISLIGATTNNKVQVGPTTNFGVQIPGPFLEIDGYISNGDPTLISSSGFIRHPVAPSAIITAKGTGADIKILSVASNLITIGDAVNTGVTYNTSTSNEHIFQVNSSPIIHIGTNYISVDNTVSSPLFQQGTISLGNGGTGQTLTIHAQSTVGTNNTGGSLNLTSGSGTTVAGNVAIQTGGISKWIQSPTTITQLTSTYAFGGTADLVNVTAPRIQHNNLNTANATGQTLTVQAQNSIGTNGIGGNLVLTSGTGNSATTAGQVNIQTGGVTWVNVNPSTSPYATVTINGNLTVLGTTTTIDSTVVDIEGRVIHGNFSTGISSPPNAPNLANSMTGYAIHRGSATGITGQDRDSAALIYNETTDVYIDGYWKLATIKNDQDGYASTTGLVATLPMLASAVVATSNPVQEFSAKTAIPTTGGFRSLNNTTAVSSRNAASSQDLLLLGTDSNNHIVMGNSSSPQNAGFIFNTTTGSIFDFWVNSTSQLQIGTNTITFTNTDINPTLSQASFSTNSGIGQTLTVRAQNATGTSSIGGILNLTSGTGTSSAGLVNINIGSILTSTFNSVDSDTDGYAEWLAIGAGINIPRLYQVTQPGTGSNTGFTFKINAQAGQQQTGTNANNNGGNLVLATGVAGTGGSGAAGLDGYMYFMTGTHIVASMVPNKFVFNQGRRRNVTFVTGAYNILATDDFLAITTLSSAFTITLPSSPVTGDCYEIKDTTGNASTATSVIISGNGHNLDGASTFVLSQPYSAVTVTYTGTQWSIS